MTPLLFGGCLERHLRVDTLTDKGDLIGDLAAQVGDRTVDYGQRDGVEDGVGANLPNVVEGRRVVRT